ncbi:MAG: sigma factor-like helix-turn-helix DNA-binding protein [Deltaproteobacteria bacterium]|nr:sigma factor-like helix-turn-helix DNA-binding protein [Deltaproteobacteria bacterium]
MRYEVESQCPNCNEKFTHSYDEGENIAVYLDLINGDVHRLAESYAPFGCFLLLCQVANLKPTVDLAFLWLHEYRVGFGNRIHEVLRTLTPREEQILILRYGLVWPEPKTLQEIGFQKDFHLSRQAVHNIERRAINRLRHPVRFKLLRDLIERIKKYKSMRNQKHRLKSGVVLKFPETAKKQR